MQSVSLGTGAASTRQVDGLGLEILERSGPGRGVGRPPGGLPAPRPAAEAGDATGKALEKAGDIFRPIQGRPASADHGHKPLTGLRLLRGQQGAPAMDLGPQGYCSGAALQRRGSCSWGGAAKERRCCSWGGAAEGGAAAGAALQRRGGCSWGGAAEEEGLQLGPRCSGAYRGRGDAAGRVTEEEECSGGSAAGGGSGRPHSKTMRGGAQLPRSALSDFPHPRALHTHPGPPAVETMPQRAPSASSKLQHQARRR